MPVRTKKGRTRVVSAPQDASEGRRAAVAPVREPRLPASLTMEHAAMALAIARGEVEIARARERIKKTDESTAARRKAERKARDVLHRARARLGPEATREIVAAISFDGGLAVRAAAESLSPLIREHGVRAILTGAAIAREHALQSTAALSALGTAMRWRALAGALLDAALLGPSMERIKVAQIAGQMARLDLFAALTIERDQSNGRGSPVVDILDAVRALDAGDGPEAPPVPPERSTGGFRGARTGSGGEPSVSSERSEESPSEDPSGGRS